MHNKLESANRRLNAFVDWFIPPTLKASRDQLQGVRMFLFSHIFGPFLGHTISLAMLYLQGGPDTGWWVFVAAVTAFWPFTLALRLTAWYVPLALLSIQNLIFCVLWGSYQYGGISSPIMPWLVTVPLLAFFYLPERKTRIAVSIQILSSLAIFYAAYSTFGFPKRVQLEGLAVLGIISTVCASVYVSMMALYYANVVSSQADLEQEIEHHKLTERQLRDATAQINQAMASRSEFLAKMSHELRNPLNAIIGYSALLIESSENIDGQRYRDLISIRSAGKSLLELITDLLDLAKLEAGKMDLHLESVDLGVFFDELATQWLPAAAAHNNEFYASPPPTAWITCDVGKLKRVISNLLSNAAKFTHNGKISLRAFLSDDSVTFSIEDTGRGIAKESLPVLFETFSHASDETASNYGEDVRLGLPLADRYCRLMGGELSVESKIGIGSRFNVRIPVRLSTTEAEEVLKDEAA